MTDLYDRMAGTALRVLDKYGATCTIGIAASSTSWRRSVKCVRNKDLTHPLVDTALQIGDIEYLVAAKTTNDEDTEPVSGERFEASGDKGVIVLATPIKPADLVIAWYVYVRAG